MTKAHRFSFSAVCAALTIAAVAVPAHAAKPPETWDGLVAVKSKRLGVVYLAPGADFRPYTKIMLDPTEVAFRKNWMRDYNSSSPGRRISQKQADEVMHAVSTGMGDTFAKAYRQAGYQVVQTPGPDVLRVRTAVIDLAVTAPDVQTAGRSRTFSQEAGEATLVVEARDSPTGALLGRALDRRVVGDAGPWLRSSVTNRADFERVFNSWAKASVEGLGTLKSLGPITPGGNTPKR